MIKRAPNGAAFPRVVNPLGRRPFSFAPRARPAALRQAEQGPQGRGSRALALRRDRAHRARSGRRGAKRGWIVLPAQESEVAQKVGLEAVQRLEHADGPQLGSCRPLRGPGRALAGEGERERGVAEGGESPGRHEPGEHLASRREEASASKTVVPPGGADPGAARACDGCLGPAVRGPCARRPLAGAVRRGGGRAGIARGACRRGRARRTPRKAAG